MSDPSSIPSNGEIRMNETTLMIPDEIRADGPAFAKAAPDMRRVVVAIDPSGTAGQSDDGDSIGIVVAGVGVDGVSVFACIATGFPTKSRAKIASTVRPSGASSYQF